MVAGMSSFGLDRKLGPMRLRAWFLLLNFIFNGVALYGLSRVTVEGAGWPILVVGVIGTLACIGVLSAPAKE